ncbi:inositol monophosphatase family protein [Cupriavidus sp. SIMBA_020]|uniref:inositol monophosphatase family protein n=1 Tax=Cupriavidus sp. SIMBA_020 TaxID=3085766 RepID=UPI00397959F9
MQTSPPLTAQQLAAFSSFAQTLADQVRPLSRQWFRHPLSVDTKADESPVTQADREVEAALRAAIASQYPDHGIFGEEFGEVLVEAGKSLTNTVSRAPMTRPVAVLLGMWIGW